MSVQNMEGVLQTSVWHTLCLYHNFFRILSDWYTWLLHVRVFLDQFVSSLIPGNVTVSSNPL